MYGDYNSQLHWRGIAVAICLRTRWIRNESIGYVQSQRSVLFGKGCPPWSHFLLPNVSHMIIKAGGGRIHLGNENAQKDLTCDSMEWVPAPEWWVPQNTLANNSPCPPSLSFLIKPLLKKLILNLILTYWIAKLKYLCKYFSFTNQDYSCKIYFQFTK